ncbi:MAG: sugar ABC transporter permease [Nitratireductor rhodophyticola]|uniref:carbohydrate ABC transporter permease n=1 Tax=Nitratireductor rhodophyticola TaxID=2854036 RepID=UPI0032D91EF0
MDQMARDEELLNRIGLDRIRQNDRTRRRRRLRLGLVFMSPALALVGVFLLLPVLFNVWLSLTKWRKFKGFGEWAGVSNYERMAGNPFFSEALINTAIWVGASIVFPILLGLGLAMYFRNLRGAETFKNIIFIPRILAPTAVGVLWFYVYAPAGLLNRLLSLVSGQEVSVSWLYSDATVTPAIIATFVWQTVGLVMVLLLLGLAALPRDPIEAAHIDGASPWQIFRHITLPLLTPTLLMVTILSVLAGFTVFDLLWVMGASYPGQRSLALAVFMYFEAFQKGNWAFGSAVAVVIGIVVLGVTWIQTFLQTRVDRMTR